MTLFELSLKAKIPFIGTRYNDPVNFCTLLSDLAGKPVLALPENTKYSVGDKYLYWTEDSKQVTSEMYRKLCASGAVCVVLNQPKNTIVFDAGVMPTPVKFLNSYLSDFLDKDAMPSIVQAIAGLSLLEAQNIVQLTMVRTGEVTPSAVRHTRLMIGGQTPGLESLNTSLNFYVMPKSAEEWLTLNEHYFINPNVLDKLVPRGLMAVGPPGTGKSTLAQAVAGYFKVPLFRLDIGSSLTRWLGESEGVIARNLLLLESNAPCVVLIDEVEKLFISKGTDETSSRILSQLLWWMQCHTGRVLTIMTSNDLAHVPKELYRPGRIDKVVEISKLTLSEAKIFAIGAYKSILGGAPTIYKTKLMKDVIESMSMNAFSHAEVVELVVDLIKSKNWTVEEKDLTN